MILRASRVAVATILVGTVTASADPPREAPTEIELDRAEPSAGRTELGFDGGAPIEGWGVTVAAGWLEHPLALPGSAGGLLPVRRRETGSLGGALALGTSVVVDARLAFAHQVGDRLRGQGDPRPLDRWVPGDLRIGTRLRVAGSAARAVFVRGDLTLPTGDELDFSGDPSWSLAWRLIGRATLPHGIVVAATAGIRFRGEEVIVADRLVGNEVLAATGFAVPIPPIRPLWCVADQVKLTAEISGVLGDDVGMGRGPSPAEVRLGVVTRPLPSVTLGVRAGAGLSDQIGAPRARVTLELTYQAAPTTSSRR
ncbi:MAG: hypothetical protein H6Q90_95 [Deltaproteobacteria bacterium]|nr:hypothetical protein [Deltaproteobacteria bacterium]